MPRWIQTLIATAIGLATGLFYGWSIAPVEYIDASPGTLHIDYRSDYAIMVAEAYQNEESLDLAKGANADVLAEGQGSNPAFPRGAGNAILDGQSIRPE